MTGGVGAADTQATGEVYSLHNISTSKGCIRKAAAGRASSSQVPAICGCATRLGWCCIVKGTQEGATLGLGREEILIEMLYFEDLQTRSVSLGAKAVGLHSSDGETARNDRPGPEQTSMPHAHYVQLQPGFLRSQRRRRALIVPRNPLARDRTTSPNPYEPGMVDCHLRSDDPIH